MAELTVGMPAPDFSAPAGDGRTISLADYRGRYVVLYFYPRDNTPGCTAEACSFRDHEAALQAAGAQVIGVSPDSVKSHAGFAAKYGLPFPLVSDPDHTIAEAYGVWKEKKQYGRTYMGIERTTFLIDPEGKIKKIWPKVKVDGHTAEVLAALKEG
jgi:peroxiredoxin Q/BCP